MNIGTRVYRPEPLGAAMPQTDEQRLLADLQADAISAHYGHLVEYRLHALIDLLDAGHYNTSTVHGVRRVKLSNEEKAEITNIVREALKHRGKFLHGGTEYANVGGKLHRRLPT